MKLEEGLEKSMENKPEYGIQSMDPSIKRSDPSQSLEATYEEIIRGLKFVPTNLKDINLSDAHEAL